jgi:hypothetical protein
MGMMVDLEEAIGLARQAVGSTLDEHPDRAGRLNNLAGMLGRRYDRVRKIADLEEASQLRREAWACEMATPFQRVEAGANGSKLLATIGKVDDAIQLGKDVIKLLPTVNTRPLDRGDQQFILTTFAGIANDLCALLLQSGQTEEALKTLEKGRAVVLGQILDSRSDISELSRQHSEIAHQYEALLGEVNRPLVDLKLSHLKTHALEQRRRALAELDACTEKIRALPKYERFMLGPTTAEMMECAVDGVLVVVNASVHRCDAILVEQHQIRHKSLPLLNMTDINENRRHFRLGSSRVLKWLWDSIAHPILDALGFTEQPSNDNWPHIWWILTGPLSKFPIHAAGYHAIGSTKTVLDRAISSYSSSIKATIHCRQHQTSNATPPSPNHALLVAMPDTLQHSKLPFASKEIAVLRRICKSMALEPLEPGQRMRDIVSHLPDCKIFHFAGHGHSDSFDPLQSHLLVEDWKSNRLSVATLLEMNLRKNSPFLAYLSACRTGRINDDKFFDESVHLISACQLAGFRHVIGTLWEVNDEFCVDMARNTYQAMRDGGMTDESVSSGLHKATRELRDQCVKLSSIARNGGKQVDPVDKKLDALNLSDGDRRDVEPHREVLCDEDRGHAKLPRDILPDDDNDDGDDRDIDPLHWVPYVHYGV